MQFYAVFYEELVIAEFEDVGELERDSGPTSVIVSPLPPKQKKNINKKEKIDISLFWIGGICLTCLQCLSSKSEDYPRSVDDFGSATNTS